MKKNIILLIIAFILTGNCQRQEVIKTHGVAYLEKRQKLMIINESNKNDTIEIFGHPATKGLKNNNLWIYIERTQTKGNFLKLGKNYTKKSNVLVLEFNDYGVLIDKNFFDKGNMQDIKFTKAITENDIKKENFIYSFLTSVRQKMETHKK